MIHKRRVRFASSGSVISKFDRASWSLLPQLSWRRIRPSFPLKPVEDIPCLCRCTGPPPRQRRSLHKSRRPTDPRKPHHPHALRELNLSPQHHPCLARKTLLCHWADEVYLLPKNGIGAKDGIQLPFIISKSETSSRLNLLQHFIYHCEVERRAP